MKKDWREELRRIITKEKNLSLAEVSRSLGHGDGYLKVMLARKNDPGLTTLQTICEVLQIPLSSLVDDIPADIEAVEIARAYARLSDDDKSAVKRVISRMPDKAEQE